jgi:D-alanyl-D-alanine carboxypeptidase
MGKTVMRNYNSLIGRYPGADGMKTGFICASGFNLVATATRNDKRLIAVVLGASSSQGRALKAAQLLERGFNSNNGLGWLIPSLGTVDSIATVDAAPPNLREDMCGAHRKRQATEDEDEALSANVPSDSPYAVFLSSLRAPKTKGAALMQEGSTGEPVVVYTGPWRKPGEPIPMTDPPKPKVAAKPKTGGKAAASNAAGAESETAAKPKPKAKSTTAKPAPKQPQTTSDAAKQTTTQAQ